MPDNNAALAAGFASAVGSGLNAAQTANLNRKNRKFAQEMYNTQKQDAINFWNMQNEYNSPAAQMMRFKDAGLNPALIYGQTNSSGPISSPDFKQPETRVPEYGSAIGSGIGGALTAIDAMTNLEMKQAQTDNLKLQADVIRQESLLKGVQARRGEFDLGLESELRATSVDARKEQLRQTRNNIDLSIRKDIREQIMTASSLREATERMKNLAAQRQTMLLQNANTTEDRKRIIAETARIKKQIELMSKEGAIKDLDVKLAKDNIRPGDPLWYRTLSQGFNTVWDFLFAE